MDSTCAPQNIRFPTDTPLLNEARENAEEIIDLLHAAGVTNSKKPRTYLYLPSKHPGCLSNALPEKKLERLAAILLLYQQQQERFDTKTHRVVHRIVSLSQHWVRPIVRGKQNADVAFGAKVERSVGGGYLRVKDMRWDAYNASTTLQESVEAYRRAYGHYQDCVLADWSFHPSHRMFEF